MTVNRANYYSPRPEQAAAARIRMAWTRSHGATSPCGTGANPVPAELTRLADASDDQDWSERFPELLNTITPTGTGQPDAEPTVTILARLPRRRAHRRPALRRLRTLIEATSCHANNVIADVDTRPPAPSPSSGLGRHAAPSTRSSRTCWPDGTSSRHRQNSHF